MHITIHRKLPPPCQLKKEHILQEYAENFSGLGCLGPPVHFTTKDNMSPIQMPFHRVPVAKREKEKVALDRYEQEGIIKKVEEPRGFHKLLEILIIVAQKRKKSCLKVVHFPQKDATFQESCSKVATLIALPSTAILIF